MPSDTHIYSLCPKCGKNFDPYSKYGPKKFCSRHCANSRGPRTEETKAKIRLALAGRKSPTKSRPSRSKKEQISKTCPICNTIFHNRARVTCSRECFKIRATQNALQQEKHGGGHKGIYKGIKCDSTYELAFVIWNLDHNVSITRCESVYDYVYKGRIYKYKPDFVVEGAEIEIKGFMSKRARAKLDQNPHIFVIDKTMMQSYLKYVKTTYKVRDLRDKYEIQDHQKTCEYCQKTYTAGFKKQKYCSNSCAINHRVAKRKKLDW